MLGFPPASSLWLRPTLSRSEDAYSKPLLSDVSEFHSTHCTYLLRDAAVVSLHCELRARQYEALVAV
jgi:hypothetical protein